MNIVIMDSAKLINKIGWEPFVDLEENISKTWEWIKNQVNYE